MCHHDESTSPQVSHKNESEGGLTGPLKQFTSISTNDEASANVISKGSSTLNGVAGKCNKTDQGPLLSCLFRWRECKGERVECALSRFYQQGETFIFGLPTKYDVLCDPSDSYSDHIGNCCFRIVAAMWHVAAPLHRIDWL